jgi:hypothetical protein
VLAAALLILPALGAPVHADDPIAQWLKQDESDGQTSNSIDGLEGLSSELRQLQAFLKSEVERVRSEIGSALAGIKIIIETIAPWVRAIGAGANIESAQFRR